MTVPVCVRPMCAVRSDLSEISEGLKALNCKAFHGAQGRSRTADTRIFNPMYLAAK